MRRLARLLLVAALGALALGGLPGVAAATAAEPTRVATGLDDFTFDSWHSDFRLGLTDEGRSTLETTETIVARFPDLDQNRGILRAIPTHYDGHPTGLRVDSVTDENGTPRDFDSETSGDPGDQFLVLTIAGEDYVRGPQTYVISYRQENVTLFPSDTSDEEFYWEVNGTGWAQPFGEVSATVLIGPELVPKLTGQTNCYQGAIDSSQSCRALTSAAEGDDWRIDANAGSLGPREGLTVAVGFQEGTFTPRDDSFTANPFPSIALGAALLGVLGAITAAALRATRWRSRPGRPTIIAEYLPPKAVNLLASGDVTGAVGKAMAAQFLSFAVRGNLRVLEAEGRKHYVLELVHADGLDEAEAQVLALLFPGLQPGTRRDLKARDTKLATALQKVLRASRKQVVADGLRRRAPLAPRAWLVALALVSGTVGVVAAAVAIGTEIAGAWPWLILTVAVLATAATLVFAIDVRPLTAAGAELRDYLKGVKLYIGLAEADRLRVLQSPEGALRSDYRPDAVNPENAAGDLGNRPLQVVKLYERLLPFAVLFGQEKQWASVLGDYYARSGTQPDWYVGSAPFNSAYFASGISAFSSSTSTSWSGTASSSSSSGSGGGGSVGGGGGGGGGGGA